MTKPPVRRRTPPHAAAKPRATNALAPVGLALGLSVVVAGIVWVAGAEGRSRAEAEREAEHNRIRAELNDWERKHLTSQERADVDRWVDERQKAREKDD